MGRRPHPRLRLRRLGATSRAGSRAWRGRTGGHPELCSGNRSLLAGITLQRDGLREGVEPRGRDQRWKQSGQDWKLPQTLTQDQRSRYSRHILIPEVGEEGQLKLLDSKALLIGAGGLGAPAAFYLAAAGVGTDRPRQRRRRGRRNLQRQIIHTTDRVGMNKGEWAKVAIEALNPDVAVNVHPFRVNRDNVIDLVSDYDIIIDGTDNFPTRYLMSDVSLMTGRRFIHGEHPGASRATRQRSCRTTAPATAACSRSRRRRTWRPRAARPACSASCAA